MSEGCQEGGNPELIDLSLAMAGTLSGTAEPSAADQMGPAAAAGCQHPHHRLEPHLPGLHWPTEETFGFAQCRENITRFRVEQHAGSCGRV